MSDEYLCSSYFPQTQNSKQDMVQKYSGKKMADMPPHIFATAETTLRYLSTEGRNQSCIISGESGAGKVN